MIRRVHSDTGLNYLTDTLTSAWDAMRANFGVSPSAAAPHGWVARPYRYGHEYGRWPTRVNYRYFWDGPQGLTLGPLKKVEKNLRSYLGVMLSHSYHFDFFIIQIFQFSQ